MRLGRLGKVTKQPCQKAGDVGIDNSAEQRPEDAFREREKRYRAIFNTIDEGVIIAEVIYDEAGRAIDALRLEGNNAESRLTGGRDYIRQLLSTFNS